MIDVEEDDELRLPPFIYDKGLDLSREDPETLETLVRKLIHGIAGTAARLCQIEPGRFYTYKTPQVLPWPE
jgi:hypothetical protein